jgi:mannan endo-1,6-alpha-mannosidase
VNPVQFSYNHAVLMQGAAFMYNYTNGSDVWRGRVENLLDSTIRDFFPNNTAYEIACEPNKGGCTADMLSFKGYVHRWMAVVTQVAPFTQPIILPLLKQSTQAAVNQCTGGETGRKCGFYWTSGEFVDPGVDHTTGAGEQMNVLAAVSSLLIDQTEPPTTNSTGGTSKGDYSAGGSPIAGNDKELRPITTGDRAGAGILTFVVLSAGLGLFGWMSYH